MSAASDLITAPVRVRPGTRVPDDAPQEHSLPGFVVNPKPEGRFKYKFRLTEGLYVDFIGPKTKENPDGRRFFQVVKQRNIFPVIETDEDLRKYNGKVAGMKNKFEILTDTEVVVSDPTLRLPGESVQAYMARLESVMADVRKQADAILKSIDAMPLEQLMDYAQAEEIELNGAKSLDAVRKAIKAAVKG